MEGSGYIAFYVQDISYINMFHYHAQGNYSPTYREGLGVGLFFVFHLFFCFPETALAALVVGNGLM